MSIRLPRRSSGSPTGGRSPRRAVRPQSVCLLQAICPVKARRRCLEPTSKLPEENNEASKLNKAQKVLGVKFPEDATLPLYPSEEALDQPASLVSSQPPPILGSHFSVGSVRRDHLDAILP